MSALLQSRKPTIMGVNEEAQSVLPTRSTNTITFSEPLENMDVSDDVQTILDDVTLDAYLMLRTPTVLIVNNSENGVKYGSNSDSNTVVIAPLNTDLRWGSTKLAKRGRTFKEAYDGLTQEQLNVRSDPIAYKEKREMIQGIIDDSDRIHEVAIDSLVIPPLNTDIRIGNILPEFEESVFSTAQPSDLVYELSQRDDFSWHITVPEDNISIKEKKKLINPVQNQHMCGSCWAMALSACISDCFVVHGTVNWMPRIAPTFLMMTIPQNKGNGQCDGGNPASTTLALESMPIADTTCIDYSWCTNDSEICTSASAANHFKSTLSSKLNSNIPTPGSACYFEGDRYLYQIDSGSEALFITPKMPEDEFRSVIKRHIVEYGPPLAGYAVLANFITGNFTDPRVNQGVYFDRADYPSSIQPRKALTFRDGNASVAALNGLHAVEVVGWGLAKNVQYDTDKFGDVPFWWAKNSWGTSWGNTKGYFKMAMYPWNKFAQFGKQVLVKRSNVGGMILVRCTTKPTIGQLPRINKHYLNRISRSMNDEYYKSTPQDITATGGGADIVKEEDVGMLSNGWVVVGIAVVVVVLLILFRRK